jgi:hypothetical protein
MNTFFVNDSFFDADGVFGGDLVDVTTPFAMRDKMMHALCGAVLQLVLARWSDVHNFFVMNIIVLGVGILVELFELARYKKYGYTRSMSDMVSWRDLVANNVGASLPWLIF